MTFKELARIIKHQYGCPVSEADADIEEAKALLQQLRTNYSIAYQRRRDKWFEKHPEEKYLNDTYEEHVRDCEINEWFWYFIERITSRTPEQRYLDEKNPDYGWNHKSEVHTIDEPCKEGCRFWPDIGRIEDIEILEDYKDYQDYEKVRWAWDSLVQRH